VGSAEVRLGGSIARVENHCGIRRTGQRFF
jgi:hypothetical protein